MDAYKQQINSTDFFYASRDYCNLYFVFFCKITIQRVNALLK